MKASYKSMQSGTILGVIDGEGKDRFGGYVIFKVTSRKSSAYPLGLRFAVVKGSPFLSER